jgi:hypothetical protein
MTHGHVRERARRRPGPLLCAVTIWWLVFAATDARAHDPGLSSLDVSVSDGAISVTLSLASEDVALVASRAGDTRQKLIELARTALRVGFDDHTLRHVDQAVSIDEEGARVRLSFRAPNATDGPQRLEIESEVPARVSRGHRELLIVRVDGRVVTEKLLDAASGSAAVDLDTMSPSASRTAWSFLTLGVRHILTGYDHLVFLAGLLLTARAASRSGAGSGFLPARSVASAAKAGRQLIVALTAFTVAHSVSLIAVVVGGIQPPASVVEPLIAASIAWIGVENLVRDAPRIRWLVVFGFGLIHGFGVAGALVDLGTGLRARDMALALVSFNAGVEAGQLAVAGLLLPLVWLIGSRRGWETRLQVACSALIAIAGGYWLMERL